MNTILSSVIILGTYAGEKNSVFLFFFQQEEWVLDSVVVGVWGDPPKVTPLPKHWFLISLYRKNCRSQWIYVHRSVLLCRKTWWKWTFVISKPNYYASHYFSQLPGAFKHPSALSIAMDRSCLSPCSFPTQQATVVSWKPLINQLHTTHPASNRQLVAMW